MSASFWTIALALAWATQPWTPMQTPGQTVPPEVPTPAPAAPLPSVNPSTTNPTVVGSPASSAAAAPAAGAAPAAPIVVNAGLNQSFTLGTLQYRVIRVTPGLAAYVLQHDQRGTRLTPGFKKDRLVVVDVEVTNPSAAPAAFTGITPALVDTGGAMTNRPQWDVRQQSYVRSTGDASGAALRFDGYLSSDDSGPYGDTTDAVMVAPGGHVDFAIVFSEPASAQPGSIRFDNTQPYAAPTGAVGVVTLH